MQPHPQVPFLFSSATPACKNRSQREPRSTTKEKPLRSTPRSLGTQQNTHTNTKKTASLVCKEREKLKALLHTWERVGGLAGVVILLLKRGGGTY
jgi:hypothetical protein